MWWWFILPIIEPHQSRLLNSGLNWVVAIYICIIIPHYLVQGVQDLNDIDIEIIFRYKLTIFLTRDINSKRERPCHGVHILWMILIIEPPHLNFFVLYSHFIFAIFSDKMIEKKKKLR